LTKKDNFKKKKKQKSRNKKCASSGEKLSKNKIKNRAKIGRNREK